MADLKRAQGDAFNLRTSHDLVYRNGNVPLSLQWWKLLGREGD